MAAPLAHSLSGLVHPHLVLWVLKAVKEDHCDIRAPAGGSQDTGSQTSSLRQNTLRTTYSNSLLFLLSPTSGVFHNSDSSWRPSSLHRTLGGVGNFVFRL